MVEKEEMQEWLAKERADIERRKQQEKKDAIPTEAEEKEAASSFKVTTQPRNMTPEEVKNEGPFQSAANMQQPQSNQQSQPSDGAPRWPEHQSKVLEAAPPKFAKWEDGVYDAEIERTWTTPGEDYYHKDEEGRNLQVEFLHIGFVTPEGRRIQRTMSINYDERARLSSLQITLWNAIKQPLHTDDLKGRKLRILVKNQPNKKGEIWPVVTEFLPTTNQ